MLKCKKIIALVLAAVMAFGLLSSCGNGNQPAGGGTSTPPAQENTSDPGSSGIGGEVPTIRIGWQSTPISVTCSYAAEQGWYDDVVNLDISYFSNGYAVNEAIAAKEIDMSNTGAILGILGCLSYDAVILGWAEDNAVAQQVWARNDSDIVAAGQGHIDGCPNIYGTPETWQGKTLITTSATSGHFAASAILHAMGLEDYDINVIDMEASSGAAAFLAGEGDLFASWDPVYSAFENDPDNYTCVGKCSDTPSRMVSIIIGSGDYVNDPANHDAIVDYLKGMAMASDVFAADDAVYHQAMIDWINEYSDVDDETGARSAKIRTMYDFAGLENWHKDTASGRSPFDDIMFSLVDFMYNAGLIEESDVEKLSDGAWINTTFMEEAIAECIAEAK